MPTQNQQPRSIRNNNPGNIRYTGIAWHGLDTPPADDKGYCRFVTASDGFRALGIDLRTKWHKDGLRTIRLIIAKFAPPEENNTDAYRKAVCDMVGADADAVLDLDTAPMLTGMCRAISFHEAGKWGFDTRDLDAGVQLALAYKVV